MVSEANSNNQESLPKDSDKFVFLPDKPVREDYFGCHERIATSIATQIESNQEGKTIGLEGTWGSGKSSVVEMLEEKWEKEKNNNIRVFKYDAWEHQGDPLRRAFLEELITNLQEDRSDNKRWLKECKIEEHEFEHCLDECSKKDRLNCPDFIRDNLRLRYEHNVIESKPTISEWGKLLAVTTLLMPVGVALFSAAKNLGDWYFWLGFICMALSPISIVGLIVYCILTKKQDTLLELIGKSKETTKHTTQRTPEPTTIEFQEYYEKILSLALKDNKQKLVIVVDNLDRVETETARIVWGTMRTFLEKSNYKDQDMISRIWVVVPYDVEAIEKLWLNAENKLDEELVLAFKEKTFQIRYHVPAPLTSKWEDYFNDKLKDAIGEQESDTNHKIFQIFRSIALPEYNNIPTPREMKIFINRVVALAKQFDPKDVILEEIALYAAMELSQEKKLENLAGEIKDELKLKNLAGNDFREGLAAIHYGVVRSEVNEVLYEPEIQEAIKDGDSVGLKELLESIPVQKVCNNYVKDAVFYWQRLDELLTAASAFAEFKPEDYSNKYYIREAIRTIAEQVSNIAKEEFKIGGSLSEDNIDDLIRLMEFHPDIIPVVKGKISIGMSKKDYGKKPEDEFDSIIKEWVKAVMKIMKFISSKEIDPTIHISLSDPIYYKKLLDIIIKEEEGSEYLKYFCPKIHIKEKYFKAYLKDIQAGTIRTQDTDIIDGLLSMSFIGGDDEKMIALSLTKPFLSLVADAVYVVYDILYKYRQKQSFDEQLALLANKGEAFKVLHKFSTNHSVAALCYVNIFKYDPIDNFEEGEIPAEALQIYTELLENMPKGLANEIVKTIVKYNLFDEICDSMDFAIKQRSCWEQILQYMIKDEKAIKLISSQRFINEHEHIKVLLDKDVKEENEEVNYYKILVEYLLDNGLIGNLVNESISCDYGHVYYIALTMENIDSRSLEKKLCKELKDIETDDWYNELSENLDGYGILDVVIELVKKNYKIGLKNKFADALFKHAKALLNEQIGPIKNLVDSWEILLNALTGTERGHFKEKLLDLITNTSKSILSLLNIYEGELERAIKEANKNAKNSFIHDKCVRIADQQNREELCWMLKLFSSNEDLLGKANKRDIDLLRVRLEDYLKEEYTKDEPQVSKEVIESVAKQLGIPPIVDDPKDSNGPEDSDLDPDKGPVGTAED